MCKYISLVIIVSSSILIGCSTSKTTAVKNTYTYAIDSYGDDKDLPNKTYILMPYDSLVSSNYLLFKELSLYVDNLLTDRGYKKSNNYDSASCIIFLTYGTSDPKTFENEVYLPIYGQTGVSKSTTNYTGTIRYYPGAREININSSTSYSPSYGVIGQKVVRSSITYYAHYMILSAFDKQTINVDFNRSIRWKLVSKIVSEDNDLRRAFPYVVLCSQNYIGKNSHQNIISNIEKNDPRLRWLLAGSAFDQKEEKQSMPIISEREMIIDRLKEKPPSLQSYKSINDINQGQLVAFVTMYDQVIYGFVNEVSGKKVVIETYPTIGKSVLEKMHWSKVFRIE
jgi:hypothetical protein